MIHICSKKICASILLFHFPSTVTTLCKTHGLYILPFFFFLKDNQLFHSFASFTFAQDLFPSTSLFQSCSFLYFLPFLYDLLFVHFHHMHIFTSLLILFVEVGIFNSFQFNVSQASCFIFGHYNFIILARHIAISLHFIISTSSTLRTLQHIFAL